MASNFFPIKARIDGLTIDTGLRTRWGGHLTKRNEARWIEIGAERDAARNVAERWRDSALNDGWTMRQTYVHEDVNRASTLQRLIVPHGLFKVHIITRPNVLSGEDKDWSLGGGEISAWGPDDLSIKVPLEYPGLKYFADALVTCPHCHRGPNREYFQERDAVPFADEYNPVATRRYSFAGRTCDACAPALQKVHEREGWND